MAGMRSKLERHRDELIAAARRHRARKVRLFGSVATGRDRAGSDVDFLVDFEPGATLLDLADLKDEFWGVQSMYCRLGGSSHEMRTSAATPCPCDPAPTAIGCWTCAKPWMI
jgi:predicted nucleotidyltransferase